MSSHWDDACSRAVSRAEEHRLLRCRIASLVHTLTLAETVLARNGIELKEITRELAKHRALNPPR